MMAKKVCDRTMLELLVLAARKYDEISEGRAVELLGWSRDKIREQMPKRVGQMKHGSLIEALDIMDTHGRRNPEGNSIMLWEREWDQLRSILLSFEQEVKDYDD
uniref:Uncharacterized protein n=1 Tax=viral metagenome TaxID=1070528 RepID=A0A6M3IH75_9ZZZZ